MRHRRSVGDVIPDEEPVEPRLLGQRGQLGDQPRLGQLAERGDEDPAFHRCTFITGRCEQSLGAVRTPQRRRQSTRRARSMKVKLLAAAAAACLVAAPSMAFSRDTPAAKVSAADTPAWTPTTVTITVGQSVTFESKGNAQPHYLEFKGPNQPACDSGVPTSYPPPSSWSGNC